MSKTDRLKWIKKIWLEKSSQQKSEEKIEILIWFPKDYYRVTGLPTDSEIETKELQCKGKFPMKKYFGLNLFFTFFFQNNLIFVDFFLGKYLKAVF